MHTSPLRADQSKARQSGRHDAGELTGGTQGTYLNSVLYTASAIRADNGIVSSPACLELIGAGIIPSAGT